MTQIAHTTRRLLHNGELYEANTDIDLDTVEGLAPALFEGTDPCLVMGSVNPSEEPPELSREEILMQATARMVEAKQNLTADGAPQVQALEELTGLKDVSAAERDAIHDAYIASLAG